MASACTGVSAPSVDASLFRIPGEFEPIRAIWVGHDPGHADFTVALIEALQAHVPIRLLAANPNAALQTLQARGRKTDGVEFLTDPESIFFVRDATVFATGPGSSLAVMDFQWNQYGLPGWCRIRHPDNPDRAAGCTAGSDDMRNNLDRNIARLAGAKVIESPLFIEGGGIEVNGTGLIIANEALIRQRNPGVSREALERMHLALPGVRKVIWLPEGLAEDPLLRSTIQGPYVAWGTGGHTDEFVRFADARTVLLAWPEDTEVAIHPIARLNRARMQRNFDVLSRATDTEGKPLRVIRLPMPKTIERRVFLSAAADRAWSKEWTADFFPPHERRREGDPVIQVASASYLNFVIANDVVVVPGYLPHGTSRATQERVRRTLAEVFPGRKIVFIDALAANWVGGGPHCATLHEPQTVS